MARHPPLSAGPACTAGAAQEEHLLLLRISEGHRCWHEPRDPAEGPVADSDAVRGLGARAQLGLILRAWGAGHAQGKLVVAAVQTLQERRGQP